MTPPCCANCSFFQPTDQTGKGLCRQSPPQPKVGFPETTAGQWCGAWREAEEYSPTKTAEAP